MEHELRNIITGISKVTKGHTIQTALRYLRESKTTSGKTQESEF